MPSWYPSDENHIAGIFFKEQVEALAKYYPSFNFTVIVFKNLGFRNNLKSPFYKKTEYHTNSFNNITNIQIECNSFIPRIIGSIDFCFKLQLAYQAKLIYKSIRKHIKINNQTVDLIHAHVSYPAGYLAMLLAKKMKIPYVITEHMGPFPFETFPYYKNHKVSEYVSTPINNASRVIAVSNSLAKRISDLGLQSPVVIPNMVNENFFIPKSSIKNKSYFDFFSLSFLTEQKGIDTLIQAFNLASYKNKNIRLFIGGAGDKTCFKNRIDKLNIKNKVFFLGGLTRDKAVEWFNNCDCFVLPSRHESFGCVYAEAIACGKPIIATKCGGPEDIVNVDNGLLCEVDNINDISEKMLYMVEHIDEYSSAKIRADFELRFSQKVVTKKIIDLYKAVFA
jgi:glycosyltransferase involved in cell wall biosynthesis